LKLSPLGMRTMQIKIIGFLHRNECLNSKLSLQKIEFEGWPLKNKNLGIASRLPSSINFPHVNFVIWPFLSSLHLYESPHPMVAYFQLSVILCYDMYKTNKNLQSWVSFILSRSVMTFLQYEQHHNRSR
jgi:hypothetical protein